MKSIILLFRHIGAVGRFSDFRSFLFAGRSGDGGMMVGNYSSISGGGSVGGGVGETTLSSLKGYGSAGDGEVSGTLIYLEVFLVTVGLGAGGRCVAQLKNLDILVYEFVMSDP